MTTPMAVEPGAAVAGGSKVVDVDVCERGAASVGAGVTAHMSMGAGSSLNVAAWMRTLIGIRTVEETAEYMALQIRINGRVESTAAMGR